MVYVKMKPYQYKPNRRIPYINRGNEVGELSSLILLNNCYATDWNNRPKDKSMFLF